MEHVILPRRSHYARTLLKWVLHLIVKAAIFVRNGFKYHTVPTILFTMAIVGSYFYLTDLDAEIPFLGTRNPAPISTDRPRSIENFFLWQKNGDAALAWQGMNETFRQELLMRGESAERNQFFIELVSELGSYSADYEFIGGSTNALGGVYLYQASLKIGIRAIDAPVTVTVNSKGEITSITSKQFCDASIFFTLYCAPIPE